jgi:hypothetical protein
MAHRMSKSDGLSCDGHGVFSGNHLNGFFWWMGSGGETGDKSSKIPPLGPTLYCIRHVGGA